MEEYLIPKLTKEILSRFSISYNKAKSLGITDEDLKYVYELAPNKFRISFRVTDQRITCLVNGTILEAINKKLELVNNSKNIIQEKEKNLNEKDLTVKEGMALYFAYRFTLVEKGDLCITTYEDDEKIYESRYFKDKAFLNIKITDVTDDVAKDFTKELLDTTPVNPQKKELSINTIYKPFALIRKAFTFFVENLKVIKVNPFFNLDKKPQYTPKPQDYLIDQEIKIVINELEKEDIRLQAQINLFLETGLRIEEMCGLKWKNLNILRVAIKPVDAMVKLTKSGKIIIKELKTETSKREIALTKYTLNILLNYRKFKNACGIVTNDDDFIFTGYDGEIISPKAYSDAWKRFARKLGLKAELRQLRHSSISYMLHGDLTHLKAVQKRSGHSNPNTTLNIYAQANLYEDRKLIEQYDNDFHNTLGYEIGDLYRICVGRLKNKKKVLEFLEKITDTEIDESNFYEQYERCQEYLKDLFPMFSKIAIIDDQIEDAEIDLIFSGFKKDYNKVKLEKLETISIKI